MFMGIRFYWSFTSESRENEVLPTTALGAEFLKGLFFQINYTKKLMFNNTFIQ